MTGFSFATFAAVISVEILVLVGLVIARHRTIQAFALSGFCASVAIYVLFQLSFPDEFSVGKNWFAPVLANETLPAVLILFFVSSALFANPGKFVSGTAVIPILEIVIRYGGVIIDALSPVATGERTSLVDVTTKLSLFAGQGVLFTLSLYALYLLFRHRAAYLQQTSENRLASIHLYVSPAVTVFVINLAWLTIASVAPPNMAPRSEYLFASILILALIWPASYLFLPHVRYHRVSVPSSNNNGKTTETIPTITETAEPKNEPDPDWIRLENFVQTKEIYLNPELTLIRLAREFGTNRAEMSRLINSNAQDNFNNYINRHRVSYAKQLLECSNASVIEIAFDSGFNSKATFNRVFRALENCTPTDYRKRISS